MPEHISKNELIFCRQRLHLYADASLYLPDAEVLIVSDLHLEKGHAQSQSAPLPRFDTDAGLAKLSAAIERTKCKRIVFLGDSFHTAQHAFRLPLIYQHQITALAQDREFIWITGNHDGELPDFLPGQVCERTKIAGLTFSHQIDKGTADITGLVCGHYHPKARLSLTSRRLSGRCFIHDDRRLILPAFGIFTGGLNILDPAIQSLLSGPQIAHFCHAGKLYKLPVDRKVFLKN